MHFIPDWIWAETWWSWDRPANLPLTFQDVACHYFNLFEATVWFVFAVLVAHRWWVYRRTSLEVVYAAAFVLFGLSDLVEAWNLTSWLLWWKLINLIVLFRLRNFVLKEHYPGQRLY